MSGRNSQRVENGDDIRNLVGQGIGRSFMRFVTSAVSAGID